MSDRPLLLGPSDCLFRAARSIDGYCVQTPRRRDLAEPGYLFCEIVAPFALLEDAEAVAAWFNEVLVDFRDEHRGHVLDNWRRSYGPCRKGAGCVMT